MRRGSYTRWLILILVAVLWLYGCGSGSGPVDELGWQYRVTDEDSTHQVDLTSTDSEGPTVKFISNTDVNYDLFIYKIVWNFQLDPNSDPLAIDIGTYTEDGLGDQYLVSKNGGTLTAYLVLNKGAYREYIEANGGSVDTFSASYNVDFTAYGSFVQGSDDNDVTIKGSTWFDIVPPSSTDGSSLTP